MRTLLITTALLLLSSNAIAKDSFDDNWTPPDAQPYSSKFQGMFTEVGVRYGRTFAPHLSKGQTLSAHTRFAFPMSIGDVRLAYTFNHLTPSSSQEASLTSQHQLGLHFAFHPLYLLMLGSNWLGYTLGAAYIDVGAGPQLANTSYAAHTSQRDAGLFWSVGAGIDIPLWSPEHGQAPWLNLSYQRQNTRYTLQPDTSSRLHHHNLMVGLAWKWNRLPF